MSGNAYLVMDALKYRRQRDELLEALKSIKDQPNCRHEVEAQLGADTWKIIDEVEQSK